MPRVVEPYQCPRCGYETKVKRDMHKHLYTLKQYCFDKYNLVLTEEIKECVLENRCYRKPEVEKRPRKKRTLNNLGSDGNLLSDPSVSSLRQSVTDVNTNTIYNLPPLPNQTVCRKSNCVQKQHGVNNSECLVDVAPEEERLIRENISEENQTQSRRYRSISHGLIRKTNRSIYLYPFIAVYKTRNMAMKCTTILNSLGNCEEIHSSVVLSEEDLAGKFFVKVGRTKYTINQRQKQYINQLSNELYTLDHLNSIEFKLESGDLQEAESYVLNKLCNTVSDKKGNYEIVGFVTNTGKISWKNEVFRVDNINETKNLIRKSLDEYQRELPSNNQVNYNQPLGLMLKKMELELEEKKITLEERKIVLKEREFALKEREFTSEETNNTVQKEIILV